MKRLLLGAALPALLGCAVEPHAPSQTGQQIINGVLDTDPAHDAVVSLSGDDFFPFCTGTFIGGRTVVSAGHCFLGGAPTFVYVGTDADADGSDCFFDSNSPACDRFFPVIDSDDPGFNAFTLTNDLSVLKLAANPVVNGQAVQPIAFASTREGTQLTAADEGLPVAFAGFGVTNGAAQSGSGRRLIVNQDLIGAPLLDAIGPDAANDIDAKQVFYNQPAVIGGPCSGDSGGPMFIKRGDQTVFAAVTSFGDATCIDFGVSTRTDSFTDFICNFADPGALGCGAVVPEPEICDDTLDNDLDGVIDCADADCAADLACAVPEVCDDTLDNDLDGAVDCADADCADDAACLEEDKDEGGCAAAPASSRGAAPLSLLLLAGLAWLRARRRS